MKSRKLAAPFTVWVLLFTVIPLGMVVWYAFTDDAGGFTLANIAAMENYISIFLDSVWLGLISTVICLILAFPLAFSISRTSLRAQQTMVMIVMLPMWMNFLLRTYVWMSILETNGLLNQLLGVFGIRKLELMGTDTAIVLGMVYNFLPFMVLPLYSVMVKIDHRIIEAGQDLGAGNAQLFGRIVLPLSMPGVLSGITMVFVPAVSTFLISNLLGNGKKMLIGDLIEQRFIGNARNEHVGSALSLVLMILILLCMALMGLVEKDEDTGGLLV
ncbi:MAG: ABC transporter permease [Oscillospiraceae bacterium]|nr:ABC transporter permease [Oscillospiraceae bacterium]